MDTATRSPGELWRAGAAAGVLAALAMIVFMMVAAAFGGDALGPLRAVGTTFRGADATGGATAVVWGVVLHLVVGAALGILFAAVVPRDMPLHSSVVLGAGCALVVMALALGLVVPRLAPGLADRMPAHGGAWVIAHAVFGAVVGIAPALRRRFGAARRRPSQPPSALRPRTSP